MSKILTFALLLCCFQSMSFAQHEGPITSGGTQGTPNLISKLQINAVLNAVTGINEVIVSVEKRSNGQFAVKIKEDTCTRLDLYLVRPVANSRIPKFEARYVTMEGNPVCR